MILPNEIIELIHKSVKDEVDKYKSEIELLKNEIKNLKLEITILKEGENI